MLGSSYTSGVTLSNVTSPNFF